MNSLNPISALLVFTIMIAMVLWLPSVSHAEIPLESCCSAADPLPDIRNLTVQQFIEVEDYSSFDSCERLEYTNIVHVEGLGDDVTSVVYRSEDAFDEVNWRGEEIRNGYNFTSSISEYDRDEGDIEAHLHIRGCGGYVPYTTVLKKLAWPSFYGTRSHVQPPQECQDERSTVNFHVFTDFAEEGSICIQGNCVDLKKIDRDDPSKWESGFEFTFDPNTEIQGTVTLSNCKGTFDYSFTETIAYALPSDIRPQVSFPSSGCTGFSVELSIENNLNFDLHTLAACLDGVCREMDPLFNTVLFSKDLSFRDREQVTISYSISDDCDTLFEDQVTAPIVFPAVVPYRGLTWEACPGQELTATVSGQPNLQLRSLQEFSVYLCVQFDANEGAQCYPSPRSSPYTGVSVAFDFNVTASTVLDAEWRTTNTCLGNFSDPFQIDINYHPLPTASDIVWDTSFSSCAPNVTHYIRFSEFTTSDSLDSYIEEYQIMWSFNDTELQDPNEVNLAQETQWEVETFINNELTIQVIGIMCDGRRVKSTIETKGPFFTANELSITQRTSPSLECSGSPKNREIQVSVPIQNQLIGDYSCCVIDVNDSVENCTWSSVSIFGSYCTLEASIGSRYRVFYRWRSDCDQEDSVVTSKEIHVPGPLTDLSPSPQPEFTSFSQCVEGRFDSECELYNSFYVQNQIPSDFLAIDSDAQVFGYEYCLGSPGEECSDFQSMEYDTGSGTWRDSIQSEGDYEFHVRAFYCDDKGDSKSIRRNVAGDTDTRARINGVSNSLESRGDSCRVSVDLDIDSWRPVRDSIWYCIGSRNSTCMPGTLALTESTRIEVDFPNEWGVSITDFRMTAMTSSCSNVYSERHEEIDLSQFVFNDTSTSISLINQYNDEDIMIEVDFPPAPPATRYQVCVSTSDIECGASVETETTTARILLTQELYDQLPGTLFFYIYPQTDCLSNDRYRLWTSEYLFQPDIGSSSSLPTGSSSSRSQREDSSSPNNPGGDISDDDGNDPSSMNKAAVFGGPPSYVLFICIVGYIIITGGDANWN